MKRGFVRKMGVGLLAAGLLAMGTAMAASPVSVTAIKAPKGLWVVESPQQALFVGGGTTERPGSDIEQAMLSMGAQKVQVYKAQYKKDNVHTYAVIIDVMLGQHGLQNMGVTPIDAGAVGKQFQAQSTAAVTSLVSRINEGGAAVQGLWPAQLYPRRDGVQTGPYTLVTPLKPIKKGVYAGTVSVQTRVQGVTYVEYLHLIVYSHPYYGPAMRIIATDAANDATSWPVLAAYQKVLS